MLPACENDKAWASREVRWMLEGILERRNRPAHYFPRPSSSGMASRGYLPVSDMDPSVEDLCTKAEAARLESWVHKRSVEKMPLQYILGSQPFCGFELKVKPPTLIPRWETEEWTIRIAEILHPHLQARVASPASRSNPFRILDLCTGTGCVGIGLAYLLPDNSVHVTAGDIAKSAVNLARINTRRVGIPPSAIDVRWVDVWGDGVMQHLGAGPDGQPQFDLVVSNPPYVTPEEYANLDDNVRLWEDHGALVAEKNGTAFHERIAKCASKFLLRKDAHGGKCHGLPRIVLEIGESQGAAVAKFVEAAGFQNVQVWQDLAKADRCVVGY
ncbi:hypothetical protein PhCBS80983_g02768 [Powellomyces hirtus]|uniref:peptide chain release factor N(5)-glutamine methyltransferase n=1 Tax=Powellomyces hirtus TaxID=109895 RepID=A0A507E4H7_9FUNG|nr:hypothetical protein PhCBS80983_g02768 [Powellomyces hirtus]